MLRIHPTLTWSYLALRTFVREDGKPRFHRLIAALYIYPIHTQMTSSNCISQSSSRAGTGSSPTSSTVKTRADLGGMTSPKPRVPIEQKGLGNSSRAY